MIYISFVLTLLCRTIYSNPISDNDRAAQIDNISFTYDLNPSVCGTLRDCFNCTLSHCQWTARTGSCSNSRLPNDDI